MTEKWLLKMSEYQVNYLYITSVFTKKLISNCLTVCLFQKISETAWTHFDMTLNA